MALAEKEIMTEATWGVPITDKDALKKVLRELFTQMGIAPDPMATAEKAQAMTLALGIQPRENLLSHGIIAAREE